MSRPPVTLPAVSVEPVDWTTVIFEPSAVDRLKEPSLLIEALTPVLLVWALIALNTEVLDSEPLAAIEVPVAPKIFTPLMVRLYVSAAESALVTFVSENFCTLDAVAVKPEISELLMAAAAANALSEF